MPLREDIYDAHADNKQLKKLLEDPNISKQELMEALVIPDDRGWTPLERAINWAMDYQHEDYSQQIQILLEAIEENIFIPLKNDPAHPLVQAAKTCVRDAFARLHPARINYDQLMGEKYGLATLRVFLDYIFLTNTEEKEASSATLYNI